tara:strand:+ start:2999 stop:3505 length:507 start_codon:yes stop_codon:yes gene_type:complete
MNFQVAAVLAFLIGSMVSKADDLGQHPFFAAITGEWIGDGELNDRAEGKVIPIHEEWTGAKKDGGSFSMEGMRNWGDEIQEFRWVFSFNTVSELFECEYWQTGMSDTLKFDVILTDQRVQIVAPFGEPGGEISIENSLKDGGIEGLVSVKNANGDVVVGGAVIHVRRE